MKVSIIVPVYNVAQYIGATLRGVLHQTVQDYEVLLIDDHGTDDSIAVARSVVGEDQRFRFLETPVNSGPGVARNIGIKAALGEYVVFLDSDDMWEPDFLEAMLEPHNLTTSQPHNLTTSQPHNLTTSFDLTYCNLRYHGGSRDGQLYRYPIVPSGEFLPSAKRYFLRHFVTFSFCFLIRRQFLIDNQLLFPPFKNSEDTNFLTRCLLLAQTIACVDRPLYIYNVRQNSLTTGINPRRYKERLNALNALMRDFNAMKRNPEYEHLHLSKYNCEMILIWLKKGLAQALKELL